MKEAGSKEFNIGVMTDKEVEKLFNWLLVTIWKKHANT
jgi:hypothetical protein